MPATSHIQRIEVSGTNGAGLSDWPTMDPANLISGKPVQRGHLYDEEDDTGYSVGIWDCTAFIDQSGPYPEDEFMFLLEGTVEMVMPDGSQVTVNTGEAFVIAKGFECQWKMPNTVRKIFMILDGETPADTDNAALHRITVPSLDVPDRVPSGALATRTTYFQNHDSRMSVYTETYPEAQRAPAPNAGRQLIYVLHGDVTFYDEPASHFVEGESLYLHPDHSLTWNVAAGTRLLISTCHLPDGSLKS